MVLLIHTYVGEVFLDDVEAVVAYLLYVILDKILAYSVGSVGSLGVVGAVESEVSFSFSLSSVVFVLEVL